MINIPRTVLRDCRAVFRRAGSRSGTSLFHLVADKHGARIRSVQDDIRVEYHHPTPTVSASFMLPMELLADCEGKDGAVQFQATKDGNVEVCWEHAGIPCRRQYAKGQAQAKPFPACPHKSIPNDPKLLNALDQAMQTIGKDTVHRSINFLQLRGTQGDMVASDGRQLLVQRGFQWPWKDPVLVPRTNVFASRELPHGSPVMAACTKEHVIFRIGPWTIALRIEIAARYPNVDSLILHADQALTRWIIDAEDAQALARTLPELSGAQEEYAAVTLDLNGSVAIRAKAEDEVRCTELALPRSRSEGKTTRIATNRTFLQRALELGFINLYVFDTCKPLLCQDEHRTFVWVPLSEDHAIAPQRNPVRVSLDKAAHPVRSSRANASRPAPVPQPFAAAPAPVANNQSQPRGWGLVSAARNLWAFMRKVRRQHEQV